MKRVMIVHGKFTMDEIRQYDLPTPSNAHWIPWLSRELMLRDVYPIAPEMPVADVPIYSDWKREFERYEIADDTVLVGHSCGAGFLVRWLIENPEIRADKLVLVAPSLGLSWDDASFFDFEFDSNLADRLNEIHIFVAQDDREPIIKAANIYREKLGDGVVMHKHQTGGHFTAYEMGTVEFPELLEVVA